MSNQSKPSQKQPEKKAKPPMTIFAVALVAIIILVVFFK